MRHPLQEVCSLWMSGLLLGRSLGFLLFSDGNLTDLPPGDVDWSKLGFPCLPGATC